MNDKPDDAVNVNASNAEPALEKEKPVEQPVPNGVDLKAENAELRDKLLRTMAEMENFRRRSDREKGDVMKYAVTAFAGDIVTIGDNLRRAIEAVQKEAVNDNPALKTLLEGVEVTERELIKVFERHGVTRFEPLGEKFDPNFHEAMLKVDVPNVAADIVVQVLQAGYKISERILRPAAVVVAKGGPAVKPAPEAEAVSAKAPEAPKSQPEAEPQAQAQQQQQATVSSSALKPAKDNDPDVVRKSNGEPRDASPRKDKPASEKRTSSVTTPVTDGSAHNRDELISSFGKRLENGS